MAKVKPYDYGQMKLVPVSVERQILPGTFESTLSRLIDEEIDLSVFEARSRNDEVGAPAYAPAILLKVILYAYARGVTSSRDIARRCRENVLFMALSADSAPHFTTIADFIATRVHGETRRALVPRFPYAIYLHIVADELVVLAVMHGRRLPRRWQSRR